MFRSPVILLRARYLFAAIFMFAAVFGVAMQGHASKTDLMAVDAYNQKPADQTLTLVQGMAELVDISGDIADVMVADPSIVDVMALQANRLYVVGINLGFTNLIVVDSKGDVIKRMNVMVTIDTTQMQRMINELFPGEDVQVSALRGQVILSGTASTPDVASRIQNLVLHHITEIEGEDASADEAIANLINVRGESQVMLRVKVLEVSRTLLRERTGDTQIQDIGIDFGDNVENTTALGGIFGGVFNTSQSQAPFAAFGLLETFGAFGPVDTLIQLLEDEGLARLMAEPNLTAISGEQAGFLAGGEFPVPSGRDTDGNVIVTFREFGVSLAFQPVVMSKDRIALEFETEVSSLSFDSDVTLVGVQVPGLDIRRASTTVEMASGSTLMIAGLLQSQTVKSLSGIPGITETPILGDLMSSKSFQRQETEMVVLVTPYLVEPFGDKRQAKKVPMRERESNDLALAFSRNIRRTYGDMSIDDLFDGSPAYGYILD